MGLESNAIHRNEMSKDAEKRIIRRSVQFIVGDGMSKRDRKTCQQCGNIFMRRIAPNLRVERPDKFVKRKFCSPECFDKSRVGRLGRRRRADCRPHPLMSSIRKIRTERGISQANMAAQSGYGRRQIFKYEAGYCSAPIWSVSDLAEVLGYELVLRKKDSALDQRVRDE